MRIMEAKAISQYCADPHKGVAKRINGETQHRKQVADLLSLKKAAEMESRNTACLKGCGDLVSRPLVRHRTA